MPDPIIVPDRPARAEGQHLLAATGQTFAVHEWSGSGPDYLYVHHADDEAWYILEGILTFRFSDRTVEAPAGTTVFVPAGVAHSYFEAAGPTRYLIILTPRLNELGEIRSDVPAEDLVVMLFAMMDGLQVQWLYEPEQIPMACLFAHFLRFVRGKWPISLGPTQVRGLLAPS